MDLAKNSLNKELQASVMLGRRINLGEARRAAFAGDTAGAMEAIASQLKGVDLEGLSPLQLQAVAEAANMSVSQILLPLPLSELSPPHLPRESPLHHSAAVAG